MDTETLTMLTGSWLIHLKAERKSPQTIKSYLTGVRLWLAYANRERITSPLRKTVLSAFVADLLDHGAEPATARARYLGVRRFSAWLAEEEEIEADPLLGAKPPKLDSKIVPDLDDAELAALLKACSGKTFRDRRDEAMVRMLAESGLRAAELLGLQLADVDLSAGTAVVRRGKGGKGRTVYVGPRTAAAVDRYLRLRRAHRLAATPALWLGDRGRELGYYGLRETLRYRAELAGIKDFHIHRLRHTAATRWLDAGGSEGGLMALAGWSRRDMLDRYTRATSQRRAGEEARRLGLGEV